MSKELLPEWEGQPFPAKAFRFSKFYLQTLFDGRTHLVRRGSDFPAHWSDEEISRRLRNAAWWRKTSIRLSHTPEGVWVQSATSVNDGLSLTAQQRSQLVQLTDENARLKEELAELRSEVWKLKNP